MKCTLNAHVESRRSRGKTWVGYSYSNFFFCYLSWMLRALHWRLGQTWNKGATYRPRKNCWHESSCFKVNKLAWCVGDFNNIYTSFACKFDIGYIVKQAHRSHGSRRLIKGESPELAGIWVVIEVVPPAISMMPVWANAHGHLDVVYWKNHSTPLSQPSLYPFPISLVVNTCPAWKKL